MGLINSAFGFDSPTGGTGDRPFRSSTVAIPVTPDVLLGAPLIPAFTRHHSPSLCLRVDLKSVFHSRACGVIACVAFGGILGFAITLGKTHNVGLSFGIGVVAALVFGCSCIEPNSGVLRDLPFRPWGV